MKIPFPAGEEPLQKILCIFPSIKIFIGWSEFLFFFLSIVGTGKSIKWSLSIKITGKNIISEKPLGAGYKIIPQSILIKFFLRSRSDVL